MWCARRTRLSGVLPPHPRRARYRAIPASMAATATISFTYPQFGEHGGARLDNGFLVLSKIGRIAVRWSRQLKAHPRRSRSREKRMAGMSASPAPMCQCSPSANRPRDRDRPWDLRRSPPSRMARVSFSRLVSQSRTGAENGPTGCRAARREIADARQWYCSPRRIRRCAASGRTFTTRQRSRWCAPTNDLS